MQINPVINTKPSPSLSYVRDLEKEWHITIPNELIDFFMNSNGGRPKFNTHIAETGEKCVLHEFLYIGSKEKVGSFDCVVNDLIIEIPMMPNYLIPFAINEEGDFYCMNIKKKFYEKIYFLEIILMKI